MACRHLARLSSAIHNSLLATPRCAARTSFHLLNTCYKSLAPKYCVHVTFRNFSERTGAGLHFHDDVSSRSDEVNYPTDHLLEFSWDDEDKIINVLNASDEAQLLEYKHFTKLLVEKILDYRQTRTTFLTLTDVLKLKGMTRQRLDKLARAILDDAKRKVKRDIEFSLGGKIIHPKFQSEQVPSSVIACNIHLNSISWVRMGRDLVVHDWTTTTLGEEFTLKQDHATIQEKIWEVTQTIPEADVYLLEEVPLRLVNIKSISIVVQRVYMDGVLTTLLNQRTLQTKQLQHLVYKLKTTEVSKYFDMLIAGERISSIDIVNKILRGSCPDKAQGVYIRPDLENNFFKHHDRHKEFMGQCLLQAIGFYKMASYFRPGSDFEVNT